jgi:hypothetical protein
VRVTLVLCFRVPEAPLIDSEYVPAGVPGGGGGVTVSEPFSVVPPYEAATVTVAEEVTLLVAAVNAALVAPAATVTLVGTVTRAGLLLVRETSAPPLGAGALRVTRPEDGDPPTTVLGVSVSDVRVGPAVGWGVTVREAVCVRPELEAEMVTVVEAAEDEVVTWKATAVAPEGTVTLAGTVATAVLLLEREKDTPPLGAEVFRVIRPVDEFPALTLVGLSASENGVAEFCGEGGGGVGSVEVVAPPPHE